MKSIIYIYLFSVSELPAAPKSGYNLDFLDKLDDPNFDPFATNTKVNNDLTSNSAVIPDHPAPMASNFIDDKLNDPDFNPFETKTKILSDGISSPDDLPALEICEKPKEKSVPQVKDSTPEFEQAEKLINADQEEPFNKLEKMISEDSEQSLLPDIPYDNQESGLTESSFHLSISAIKDQHTSAGGDPFSPNIEPLSQPSMKKVTENVDVTTTPKGAVPHLEHRTISSSSSSRSANNSQILNHGFSTTPNQQQPLSDQVKDQLARNELIFQAQLLEKDKELHAKEKEIQSIDQEVNALKRQLREFDDGNNDMM